MLGRGLLEMEAYISRSTAVASFALVMIKICSGNKILVLSFCPCLCKLEDGKNNSVFLA